LECTPQPKVLHSMIFEGRGTLATATKWASRPRDALLCRFNGGDTSKRVLEPKSGRDWMPPASCKLVEAYISSLVKSRRYCCDNYALAEAGQHLCSVALLVS
jgi:hypothetical protein